MIGIFDSGVGGLTVVDEVFKKIPKYQIIYFGDTARLPYGTKGEKFVKEYSEKIANWLEKKGVKLIIIACHTSSVWAFENLKKKIKIPVFEMVTPVLDEILKDKKNKRIGIIGTPGTIKSNLYQRKLLSINPSLKVYSQACPLFVPLAEESWINKKETESLTQYYLKELKKKNIDTLVLACTHYPLLKKTIKKIIGPKVKIINPAESLVKKLKIFLKNNPSIKLKKGTNHKFYFSDTPYHLKQMSKLALGKEIKATIKDPF